MYLLIPLANFAEKAVTVFVAAAVVFWLWNSTVPEVFGLKRLTYWQSLRLLAMVGFIAFWIRWITW